MHDLEHGVASPASQVERDGLAALFEMLQGEHMRVGEVVHVHIITETSAVGRGIVGAEDFQLGAIAGGGECQRDEVSLRIMELADLSTFIGTGGVEVAETG